MIENNLGDDIKTVGYAALINKYKLKIPVPATLSAVGVKHKNYENVEWRIYSPRYTPEETLAGHLVFALKYEGVDLAVLNSLFAQVEKEDVEKIVSNEPNGSYARRVWFLYEWLTDRRLDIADAKQGNTVNAIDEKLQYAGTGKISKRHKVRNNLPGVRNFCPLIRRTRKLEAYLAMDLPKLAQENIGPVHADLLSRAAAFLLLKDSKASYAIEGERPPQNKAERWGSIIGKAGQHDLSRKELEKLQREVIADSRFIHMGFRQAGGFIGVHDRITNAPVPDHISARHQDLNELIDGMIEASSRMKETGFPPVLAAACIGFGFVFIHPFEDGNGRLHRYLLHHVLAQTGFTPKVLVFPVSSVILEKISEYRSVLEAYSRPRLDFIEWKPTPAHNVEVLNDTKDLYRFFDATKQAEFLYDCVYQTIVKTLPEEVAYLEKYDRMKGFIESFLEMPDRKIDLLISFLNREGGRFSKRARENEFAALTDEEASLLEDKFQEIF